MNTKTVLYVHHGKGLGGAPISLVNLMVGIKNAGFKPLVVFLHESQAINLFREAGIETIGPVNLMDFSHTKIYWFRWYHLHHQIRCFIDTIKTIFFVAPKIYDQYKPDIIHLNTSSLLGWGIAAYRKKIPLVWHIRESLAAGYFGIRKNLTQKIINFCATKIVAICETDGKPWAKSAKLAIIYNAVNESFFTYENNEKKFPPTMLFVGGIAEQKGTFLCLQIFEKIIRKIPEAHLIIAGNNTLTKQNIIKKYLSSHTKYHQKCLFLIERMSASITMTGPTTNIPQLMRESSILIFPATVDHFARPVIEAGFMKLPSLGSNFPQIRELILDRETGFVINHKDQEAWATIIYTLLTNEPLRKKMGNEAYIFCKKRFSLLEQVRKVAEIYQAITPNNKPIDKINDLKPSNLLQEETFL